MNIELTYNAHLACRMNGNDLVKSMNFLKWKVIRSI